MNIDPKLASWYVYEHATDKDMVEKDRATAQARLDRARELLKNVGDSPESYWGHTEWENNHLPGRIAIMDEVIRDLQEGKDNPNVLESIRDTHEDIDHWSGKLYDDAEQERANQRYVAHKAREQKTLLDRFKKGRKMGLQGSRLAAYVSSPADYTVTTKDGVYKPQVDKYYKMLRGVGEMTPEGDMLIEDAPWVTSYFTGLQDNVHRQGVIKAMDKHRLIPRATLKALDPYHKDYVQAMNTLFDGTDKFRGTDYFGQMTDVDRRNLRSLLGRVLTLRALKNINKSTNKLGTLNMLAEFMDDYGAEVGAHASPFYRGKTVVQSFDSANQVRDKMGELFQRDEARRKQAEDDEIAKEWKKLPKKLKAVWENAPDDERRRMLLDRAAGRVPEFYYADEIRGLAEDNGWKLAQSKKELVRRGEEMHHCVGRYGDYVQNNECFILMKGNATAEIAIHADDNGVIDSARINQVKGPHNSAVSDANKKGLEDIAQGLIGMSLKDDGSSEDGMGDDVQGVLSDLETKDIDSYMTPRAEGRAMHGALTSGARYGL